MTHIIPLVTDRIVEKLIEYCITNVPHSDPTRLNEVKVGRYQQDPNTTQFRVSVQGGDLENPDLLDRIVDTDELENVISMRFDPREIGGTQLWIRNGTIRIELFCIVEKMTEEESRDTAYTILGRIQSNIENIYVADLTDDYGEKAIRLFSTQNNFFQSGGPPSSWIWRGKVVWHCLTER